MGKILFKAYVIVGPDNEVYASTLRFDRDECWAALGAARDNARKHGFKCRRVVCVWEK
jgi:hypothetical protein